MMCIYRHFLEGGIMVHEDVGCIEDVIDRVYVGYCGCACRTYERMELFADRCRDDPFGMLMSFGVFALGYSFAAYLRVSGSIERYSGGIRDVLRDRDRGDAHGG